LINWLTISATHFFYRKKARKESPERLKFKVPGYPLTTIAAVLLIMGILISSPLYPGQTAGLIEGLILLAALALIYLILKSKRFVK